MIRYNEVYRVKYYNHYYNQFFVTDFMDFNEFDEWYKKHRSKIEVKHASYELAKC